MNEEPIFHISNPEGKRELIMVVDDDSLVTMLVERLLTTEGYRVVTASDGFHAVAIYEKLHGQVQLVILDFKMPGMDGFAVSASARGPHQRLC